MRTIEHTPIPIYFGSEDTVNRAVFGWFHSPNPGVARGVGVVLCNPVGDDDIRAHRTYRHLAERLSNLGFAVLRFDFHGTGDSAGQESDPERVSHWLKDIDLAISELRQRSGVKKISLLGLRLGATLAVTVAANRGDIDSIVLWNPCLTGKEYADGSIRQHQVHAMITPESFEIESLPENNPSNRGKEALGFFLSDETLAELSKISLLELKSSPVPKVMVLGEKNDNAPVIVKLRSLGVEVDYVSNSNMKFLLIPPHLAELPTEALTQIVNWFERRFETNLNTGVPNLLERRFQPGPSEKAVRFGENHSLFGIFSPSPESALPAIIMINAGTVHRIGPHRSYVRMAREWSKLGFPVLRMDLSGIGDSQAETGTQEGVCYPSRSITDIQAAMDFLQIRFSLNRFVVVGLCSGADNAFQVGLTDPRVVGAVMMNPLTFRIHDQETVEMGYRSQQWQNSVLSRDKWTKLIRGELNLAPIFRNLVGDIFVKGKRQLHGEKMPEVKNVPESLESMAKRGVDMLLVSTVGDPGIKFVDTHFPDRMKSLEKVRGFKRKNFKGTDHTFTSRYAQKLVLETITDHLIRNHSQS